VNEAEIQLSLARSPRFVSALSYATTLHGDDTRKGTSVPYVSHLYSVASLVMEAEGTETEVIGALLHDAAEDKGIEILAEIRTRYGDEVATIVEGCSDDTPAEGEPKKPWQQRKDSYITHLKDASHSIRLVSNADKLHNARSILRDYREMGDILWERFNSSREQTLWYYRALADIFTSYPANNYLADELNRVITELERLVQN
jgi:(p)ppGpp synthase/HD superfamily hydrolase